MPSLASVVATVIPKAHSCRADERELGTSQVAARPTIPASTSRGAAIPPNDHELNDPHSWKPPAITPNHTRLHTHRSASAARAEGPVRLLGPRGGRRRRAPAGATGVATAGGPSSTPSMTGGPCDCGGLTVIFLSGRSPRAGAVIAGSPPPGRRLLPSPPGARCPSPAIPDLANDNCAGPIPVPRSRARPAGAVP